MNFISTKRFIVIQTGECFRDSWIPFGIILILLRRIWVIYLSLCLKSITQILHLFSTKLTQLLLCEVTLCSVKVETYLDLRSIQNTTLRG
jgi:hypothetical protein